MDAWIGNPELHGDELVWKPRRGKRRHRHAAPGDRPVPAPTAACGWSRAISAARCSRPARSTRSAGLIEAPARCFSDQNEVLEAFKAGELDRDVRGRRPLPGPARQRHARAAQADADARRAPGPRPQGRADHRRPHVGRQRQGARGDPRLARGACPTGRWRACATATSIRLDARNGTLEAVGVDLAARPPANSPPPPVGTGRELFALMRLHADHAEAGASAMLAAMEAEQA